MSVRPPRWVSATETCEGSCGSLGWTREQYGRLMHKHSCPLRVDAFCQSHDSCAAPRAVEPSDADEVACPICFHVHMGYNDEPCVSCGCDPTGAELLAAAALRAALRQPQVSEPQHLVARHTFRRSGDRFECECGTSVPAAPRSVETATPEEPTDG